MEERERDRPAPHVRRCVHVVSLNARGAVLLRPEAVCIAARDALERALRAAGEVRRRRDSHRIEEAAAAVLCVPTSPPIDPITTPQPDSSDCGVLVHKLM